MKLARFAPWVLAAIPAGIALSSADGQESYGGSDAIQDEMAKWMELAERGENHAKLEPLAGTFNVKSKFRMAADAPWMEGTGTMQRRWVLGERFLLSEFKGQSSMGPFEGLGLMGYDNAKKRYVSIWADSMGTMILPQAEGTLRDNVLAMTTTWDSPISGKKEVFREVTTIRDARGHVTEMFTPGQDGKEYKNLVLTYTRR